MCPVIGRGNMNETKDELSPLVHLLAAKMRLAGMSEKSLATYLGISQSYLSQLLNGRKDTAGLSEIVLRRCAGFLEMPAVVCFLLAGRLLQEDFFDSSDSLTSRVSKALKVVATSRYAQETSVTSELLGGLPEQIQLLIVLLYETATGSVLIPGRVGAEWVSSSDNPRVPFEV